MPDDLSLRKDVRRREKAAKLADANRRATLSSIMSTAAGRQWVYELLESCHCFRSSITQSPYLTYANEGERNVGLRILTDIMASCSDEYVTMAREAQQRIDQDVDRDARQPSSAGPEPIIDSSGNVVDYLPADASPDDYDPQP